MSEKTPTPPPAGPDAGLETVAWMIGDDGAVYKTARGADRHVQGWIAQGATCDEKQPLVTHASAAAALEAAAERERELLGEIDALTKGLTGLTCGGSEFFSRKGERYVADVKACVDWVRRAKTEAVQGRIEAIRQTQSAEARAAEMRKALEAMIADAEKLRIAVEGLAYWMPELEEAHGKLTGGAREAVGLTLEALAALQQADSAHEAEGV